MEKELMLSKMIERLNKALKEQGDLPVHLGFEGIFTPLFDGGRNKDVTVADLKDRAGNVERIIVIGGYEYDSSVGEY